MHLLVYADDLPTASAALALTDLLATRFSVTADLLAPATFSHEHPFRVLPWDRVTRLQAAGHAEQAILDACRTRSYDLVLVAPAGRKGLVRMVLGSRVGALVHQAPVSVLIARQIPTSIQQIVVGVSGSPQSESDARLAGILARAFEARLSLAHILSQVPLTYTNLQHVQTELELFLASEDPAARQLRRARDILAETGLEPSILLREGLVRDELLALLTEVPADLLVVGAHVRAGARLDYYEDIAEQVAQAAPISTLTIRAEPDWQAWQPLGSPKSPTLLGSGQASADDQSRRTPRR